MQSSTKSRVEILMAEDSHTQAIHLQRILEGQGYIVQTARNGQDALDYLLDIKNDPQVWQQHKPAMVISDIIMPQMTGCELCYRLKSDPDLKELPVILLTSLSDSREALKGLYSGADNLISKPYDAAFLLARVDEILSMSGESAAATGKLLPITMDGQKYFLSNERLRTINLILTTYETAVQKNLQLEATQETLRQREKELQEAQRTIERLSAELEAKVAA